MRLRTGQAVRYLALASFAAMAFSIAHSSVVVQLLFGSAPRDGAARQHGELVHVKSPPRTVLESATVRAVWAGYWLHVPARWLRSRSRRRRLRAQLTNTRAAQATLFHGPAVGSKSGSCNAA